MICTECEQLPKCECCGKPVKSKQPASNASVTRYKCGCGEWVGNAQAHYCGAQITARQLAADQCCSFQQDFALAC